MLLRLTIPRTIAAIVVLALLAPAPLVVAQSPAQQPASPPATGKPGAEPEEKSSPLKDWKDIADIAQAAFTIAGLIVGGIWTWMLFVKKREKYPRAKVTHVITHKPFVPGKRLLHVTTRVENTGGVLLEIISGLTRVQQVLPAPTSLTEQFDAGEDPVEAGKTEYEWPLVAERTASWHATPLELEPGENEEIHCDFFVDTDTKLVEVYSYFKNKAKPKSEIGWNLTTLYDLSVTRRRKGKRQPA